MAMSVGGIMLLFACVSMPENERQEILLPAKVSVQMPSGEGLFPGGVGADLANGYCLTCHSVDMVMLQPPLTLAEWTATIGKMRLAFGAPLPDDDVQRLARYLTSINGRPAAK